MLPAHRCRPLGAVVEETPRVELFVVDVRRRGGAAHPAARAARRHRQRLLGQREQAPRVLQHALHQLVVDAGVDDCGGRCRGVMIGSGLGLSACNCAYASLTVKHAQLARAAHCLNAGVRRVQQVDGGYSVCHLAAQSVSRSLVWQRGRAKTRGRTLGMSTAFG